MLDTETHEALGLHQPKPAAVNGRSNADALPGLNHPADRTYHPCSEAFPAPDTATGAMHSFKDWADARVFPNTVRDMWTYTTHAQAADAADAPHNLMVFQDGVGYRAKNGAVRVTQVLDSMRASGELPPTLAIFINPGRPPGTNPMGSPDGWVEANVQRSFEYDSVTPAYANFVVEDVLPLALSTTGVTLTEDPAKRLIGGISSGGICAFNAAWHMPEMFGTVLSHCGSFTNIRGGHNLQSLVRITERKPIRVFLQSGENDIETLFGNWPLANQTMADSLRYAGYEHRFEFGVGGHTLRHGGALFADSIRWLWQLAEE